MLDYREVLADPAMYQDLLSRRGFDLPVEEIRLLVDQRNSILSKAQDLRRQLNAGSKEIGKLTRQKGPQEEIERQKALMTVISQDISQCEQDLPNVNAQLEALMLTIPNVPATHTPVGSSELDNVEIKVWSTKPTFDFVPRNHFEIGEAMNIFDFERGVKLSGSRFSVLRGAGARLERAISNFLYDTAVNEHNYIPVSVPYMVKREIMQGTGQLPKFEEDLFKVSVGGREWLLIPTAEVPVTNLHSDEILEEKSLPITYCSLTPCFRAEAGSAGRDIQGLIRQHQFEKLEMVRFCKPEDSWKELDVMTQHAENVLQKLGLHYRVVVLATGDTGFAAHLTQDLEVWLPGQNAYREISSCSNFGEFQARRARIRYRDNNTGKNTFVHTLNGSAMPIGRTLIAILEQFQRADGSIVVPEVLKSYTGFSVIYSDGSV